MQNHISFQPFYCNICIFPPTSLFIFSHFLSIWYLYIVSFIFETVCWSSTATKEISVLSSLFCTWFLKEFPVFLLPKERNPKLQNSLWLSYDTMSYFCLAIINGQNINPFFPGCLESVSLWNTQIQLKSSQLQYRNLFGSWYVEGLFVLWIENSVFWQN